jgi:hypothetical protein
MQTADGRTVSESPAHHIENVLRKRIGRGEIPRPETSNISMATLLRVAGRLALLNQDDLGCWAGLAKLSVYCDTSPSQIREVCRYLETHGHALRLRRVSADDRKVGDAKSPLTEARTTIRPVFAITCEMAETLSADDIIDYIAADDRRVRAKDPAERALVESASAGNAAGAEERASEQAGEQAGEQADTPAAADPDVAPEHRCLVEPLQTALRITGLQLPLDRFVLWLADEADRAHLVDYEQVDLSLAADAVRESNDRWLREIEGAEAMGESPPKFRGGAKALRARLITYLEGKLKWLREGGDVFQARDDARAREAHYLSTLSPEQLERRGLKRPSAAHLREVTSEAAAPGRASGANSRRSSAPPEAGSSLVTNEDQAPAEQAPQPEQAPRGAQPPTPQDHAIGQLRTRIGAIGVGLACGPTDKERERLMAEHARLMEQLAKLVDGDEQPPEAPD